MAPKRFRHRRQEWRAKSYRCGYPDDAKHRECIDETEAKPGRGND
jgi:hypothetical protein